MLLCEVSPMWRLYRWQDGANLFWPCAALAHQVEPLHMTMLFSKQFPMQMNIPRWPVQRVLFANLQLSTWNRFDLYEYL